MPPETRHASSGPEPGKAADLAKRLLPHLAVLLLFALIAISKHFLTPFYNLHVEDAASITGIELAGTFWRYMERALFSWYGLPLFQEHWQGFVLLSAGISAALAFSAYLLWLELAPLMRGRVSAFTGGHAPGLLAGYLIIMLGYNYITDISGVSYRLAGLFAFLTLAFALRYLRTRRWGWWGATMLAYVCAAASNTYTWPLILLVLLLELSRRRRGEPGWGMGRWWWLRYLLLALAIALVAGPVLLSIFDSWLNRDPSQAGLDQRQPAPDFLLCRFIYVVLVTTAIHHLSSNVPFTAGPLEYVAEALLWLATLVGVVRMARGRGLDLFGLVTIFVMLWFAATMPQQMAGSIEWQGGVHRFNYPQIGPLLVAGYIPFLLLWLPARLLPGTWLRPRRVALATWCLLLAFLPWSPAAAGLAEVARTGNLGFAAPCPALARCPDTQLLEGDGPHDLSRAGSLRCADLAMRKFGKQNLTGADLRRADLSGAHLTSSQLNRAQLQHACAFFTNLNEVQLKGADLRQARIIGSFMNRTDLTGANLRGTSLRSTHVQEANLKGVDLRGADLVRTTFARSNMRGVNLAGANLTCADLSETDLRDANLRGATLVDVGIHQTQLMGADLEGAIICRWKEEALRHSGIFVGTPRYIQCKGARTEQYYRPPWL